MPRPEESVVYGSEAQAKDLSSLHRPMHKPAVTAFVTAAHGREPAAAPRALPVAGARRGALRPLDWPCPGGPPARGARQPAWQGVPA